MATPVRLFVSAGPAEEPAREALGQALAGLPVNIGWVLKRTPDVDSVPECHLYAILLGRDIVAPVGLEYWWAVKTEKPVLAYLRDGARTPAGFAFKQASFPLHWTGFADLTALQRLFQRDVARFLLQHAERYGVTAFESEILKVVESALEKPITRATVVSESDTDTPQGAGGGGVILAPGKDKPRRARPIQAE